MLIFETLLALVAASVVLALVARWLALPLAVALVLGGMGLAFSPVPPAIELEPELALALFLPPLLQASAQRTDWQAFRSDLAAILLLALGAVVFTALVVGSVAKWLVPSLPWWAAIALGAIVAPPDAVAATAVLKEFRIPKRIVTVLEGESLINDASSLVLYRFAVAATMAGTVSLGQGSWQFLLSAFGGGAIGIAAGWLSARLLSRLADPMLEIVVSVLAGFGAYLAAEAVHVSGVLAAVACGALLGRHLLALSARTRIEAGVAWSFLEFVLTVLVFMLIGMQLRGIVERLVDHDFWHLARLAVAVSAVLILSRIAWVFATFYPLEALQRAFRERTFAPPLSYPLLISWAGMRGVVSLATALALPGGFPERDIIVFLAFCAILATLVLQGTTLGPLIRRLSLDEPAIEPVKAETLIARKEVAAAALDAVAGKLDDPEHRDVAGELVGEFQSRVEHAEALHEDAAEAAGRREAQLNLRLTALEAARTRLVERRDELDGDTLATLVQELDLEEAQIRVALEGASAQVLGAGVAER